MTDHHIARERVVAMCRAMMQRGYLRATEGNVSVRVPGLPLYAVTPSDYDYRKMRPEDVAILDLRDGAVVDAPLPASVEAGLHARIYRSRPDVGAVVHTHQPYVSTLAHLRRPIPALTDEQARFLGRRVDVVDYAPSGTGLLASRVERALRGGANAVLLANHGALALGRDPDRAVFTMALLEKAAMTYVLALATGAEPHTVPAPIREIAVAKLRAEQKQWAERVTEALPPLDPPPAPPPVDKPRVGAPIETRARQPHESEPHESEPHESDLHESDRLGYAISDYLDVDDTYRRLDALVSQPVRPIRRDAMLDVLRWFDEECAGSKSLAERARARIPGGVQHNLAFNHPFPIAMARAEGAWLEDVDGNRYIDFLQAGGPTILGSNHAPVRERVETLLREVGPVTGLAHEAEVQLAEAIHRYLPSIETYRALGSGTEGVMAAVRAARAFTGKPMVIKVGGAYHGWSDSMVVGLRVPGTWRLNAKGIPWGATAGTRETWPHSVSALRRKLIENRARGGTAAVVVEPVGPESGTRPVPFEWNTEVRALCDEFGALLVFDEVVTGFRLGMGGAQGYYGVTPDLTVLGKAVAGGYPMAGGVGGRADIMALFGSGLDGRTGAHIQVGGTLSANPLSCLAGVVAIEEMARTNAPVVAGRAGDRLTAGLQRLIAERGLPYVAYNQGSIVHLEVSGVMLLDMHHPLRLARQHKPRKRVMEEFGAAYTAHGLITLAGSRLYTSMADTDEVVDAALERVAAVLSLVEA